MVCPMVATRFQKGSVAASLMKYLCCHDLIWQIDLFSTWWCRVHSCEKGMSKLFWICRSSKKVYAWSINRELLIYILPPYAGEHGDDAESQVLSNPITDVCGGETCLHVSYGLWILWASLFVSLSNGLRHMLSVLMDVSIEPSGFDLLTYHIIYYYYYLPSTCIRVSISHVFRFPLIIPYLYIWIANVLPVKT